MNRLSFLFLIYGSSSAYAQQKSEPAKKPFDTPEGIVTEMLYLISGEKDAPRDWESFRMLFLPTAQFTAVNHVKDSTNKISSFNLEQFIRLANPGYLKEGFLEYEISKKVDTYNGIAQVFQTYHTKMGSHEDSGINTYQLVYDGNRWWICSLLWTNASNGIKVPQKYMGH